MSTRAVDPALRTARRECVVVLLIWIAAMTYTVGYSYFQGYLRSPAEVQLYWGIPDWVLFGVLTPWGVCWALSLWFSYVYMQDVQFADDTAGADDDEEEDWLNA